MSLVEGGEGGIVCSILVSMTCIEAEISNNGDEEKRQEGICCILKRFKAEVVRRTLFYTTTIMSAD